MTDVRKTCITGKLPPPVGTSERETFPRDSLCADKTQMITEIVRELPHGIEKTLRAPLSDDPAENAPVVPME